MVARRPARPVSAAVDRMLADMELDNPGEAKAAIARALASKLDEAVTADGAGVAMAVAGIAKELREVVDAILEGTADDGAFVADLFAPVGNT